MLRHFVELTEPNSHRHLIHPRLNGDGARESASSLRGVVGETVQSVGFFLMDWNSSLDTVFEHLEKS